MFFASFNRGVGQGGATFRSLILQKKQRIIKDQEHFQKQPWKLIRTNDFFLLTRLLAAATAPSISDMSVKPMKGQHFLPGASQRLAATQPRLRRRERRTFANERLRSNRGSNAIAPDAALRRKRFGTQSLSLTSIRSIVQNQSNSICKLQFWDHFWAKFDSRGLAVLNPAQPSSAQLSPAQPSSPIYLPFLSSPR